MTHLLSLASQKSKIIISKLNLITVINAEKFTILKNSTGRVNGNSHPKPLGKGINHIMCIKKIHV